MCVDHETTAEYCKHIYRVVGMSAAVVIAILYIMCVNGFAMKPDVAVTIATMY
jgi:putative flippase GtrA